MRKARCGFVVSQRSGMAFSPRFELLPHFVACNDTAAQVILQEAVQTAIDSSNETVESFIEGHKDYVSVMSETC